MKLCPSVRTCSGWAVRDATADRTIIPPRIPAGTRPPWALPRALLPPPDDGAQFTNHKCYFLLVRFGKLDWTDDWQLFRQQNLD
jgi:hypothetical protein